MRFRTQRALLPKAGLIGLFFIASILLAACGSNTEQLEQDLQNQQAEVERLEKELENAGKEPPATEEAPVREATTKTGAPAVAEAFANAVMTYKADIFGVDYRMENFEVIDIEAGEFDGVPDSSRCVALIFDLTTVTLPEDQPLGNPLLNPSFTLVVDGVEVEQGSECLESLRATGAFWIVEQSTEAGITGRVGSTFVIAADAEPAAIVFLDEKIEIR